MNETAQLLYEELDRFETSTLKKGAEIYRSSGGGIILEEKGEEGTEHVLLVPSQSGIDPYCVIIDVGESFCSCNCPAFASYEECKHIAAAVFYFLIKELDQPIVDIERAYKVNLKEEVRPSARLVQLPLLKLNALENTSETWKSITAQPQELMRLLINNASGNSFGDHKLRDTVRLIAFDKEQLQWTFSVTDRKKENRPEIRFNGKETYWYRCSCTEIHAVCRHVKVVFEDALSEDRFFFIRHKNLDDEKARLLEQYGLKPDDEDADLFEFQLDQWGRLSLKAPSFIWKKGEAKNFSYLKEILAPKQKMKVVLTKDSFVSFEIGLLFNFSSKHFPNHFELELLKIIDKNGKRSITKSSLYNTDNTQLMAGLPDVIKEKLSGLSAKAIVSRVFPQQMYYGSATLSFLRAEEEKKLIDDYYQQLKYLWPFLQQRKIYKSYEERFSVGKLQPVNLAAADALQLSFSVQKTAPFITIRLLIECNGKIYAAPDFQFKNNLFIEIENVLYLPETHDRQVLKEFEKGQIRIHESDKNALITEIIPHLQRWYKVNLPDDLMVATVSAKPRMQIFLKEYDDKFLMLQPQLDYDGIIVDYEPMPEVIFQLDTSGNLQTILRDEHLENNFFERLRSLHPSFEKQLTNTFFYLPFGDVMKGRWLLNIISELQQQSITVAGIDNLKKFKYNTGAPKWEMQAGSGIDWFDLKIEISFGDQFVSLLDVRKAVMSGQNTVVLGDGTFGMLPDKWLEQYGMLLKMGGIQNDGSLHISKLHYTLIDELHGQIDNEEIFKEIEEKKQRLRNIENVAVINPSKQIKAKHRPYQLTGFQWMQVLDEVGWGGCLADDMGLGKTLQAITFLQFLIEKYPGSTHLVVCPTSLIYNWETELQKFAPSLKYHIYYGNERNFSEDHFQNYDIILTSYGVLRLDIEHLMLFQWHYIILDESQAIKNPEAQITKALQLLKTRNRLILSGTPVQNNTYDLYAQFNFINPGLLGNKEFFKTEFANPIDKNNDAEKSNQLRRLVYPFLLRRTKEQVAPDLPDKTETVLWCDMPKDQRAVYNHYKDYYRKLLMEKIEEEGMAKTSIYVLEGLLRLRQICDSPALLKAADIKTKTSIKMQELLREIQENMGQHKLLVFSQFTEMLSIIKQELDGTNIQYCYLDGSTPAEKRQEAVAKFQEDDVYKVFLISLKAGGVGLNLTAANYVYIVDPWWNPAVEQQAIDRTHRIGQKQKIFAYKMICKDTVEEKILQLQSRKKQLANDLITEDAGFIKKLNKEDIAFLFS